MLGQIAIVTCTKPLQVRVSFIEPVWPTHIEESRGSEGLLSLTHAKFTEELISRALETDRVPKPRHKK